MWQFIEKLIPLLGVLLGVSLSEVVAWRRSAREEKQILHRALAELLELRSFIVGMTEVTSAMAHELQISAVQAAEVHDMATQLLGDAESLRKRYGEVVTLVASIDPILAYRMRGKDVLLDLLPRIRSLATSAGEQQVIDVIRPFITEKARKTFDSLITDLARRTSRSVRREALKRIAQTPDMPAEFTAMTTQIKKAAARDVPVASPASAPEQVFFVDELKKEPLSFQADALELAPLVNKSSEEPLS
jgi:hypothetical protein